MRKFVLTLVTCLFFYLSSALAQQVNPFDQLYRDTTGITKYVAPIVSPSKSKGTPNVDPSVNESKLPDTIPTTVSPPQTILSEMTAIDQGADQLPDSTNPFEYGREFGKPDSLNAGMSKSASGESPAQSEGLGSTEDDKPGEIIDSIGSSERISGALLFLFFLTIFLMLTIIININRELINKIYRAALNENFSALLYRESRHSALNYLYPLAYIIFFLNVGLFLYLVQFNSDWYGAQKLSLLLLILAPFTVYIVRHSVLKALGTVFPIGKEINQFNFNIMVFNIVLGLILIPINLFLAYGPEIFQLPLLYGTLFIIGIIYIFRQLRGLLISSRIIISNVFLFFIYLCAVEILPLLVLFKFIV